MSRILSTVLEIINSKMAIQTRTTAASPINSFMGGDYNLVQKREVAMTMVWAAPCDNCGKMSAARESLTGPTGIEFPHPNRKTVVECPHCEHQNEFSDGDLIEVDANVLEKKADSVESTTDRPDAPSDTQQ